MLRSSRSLLGMALLAGSAAAQQHFSAPPGFLWAEGQSSTVAFTPFYDQSARAQWVYGGLRGNVYSAIKRLELRRDGAAGTGTFPARTVEASVLMADADLAALSTTFASNYASPPQLVFTRKALSLPDHSQQPLAAPAPWDVVLPLDTSYAYLGGRDLLVEITVDGNTSPLTPYSIDCVVSGSTSGAGSSDYLDPAGQCATEHGPFTIQKHEPLTNAAQSCTLANHAVRGPANAPGVWALGVSDPQLVGLLCAPLRTSVEVALPIATDALGDIGSPTAPIAVTFRVVVGTPPIYSQFAALDASQPGLPIALSDAVRTTCVPSVGGGPQSSFLYGYGGAAATTGTRYTSYIAVLRVTY